MLGRASHHVKRTKTERVNRTHSAHFSAYEIFTGKSFIAIVQKATSNIIWTIWYRTYDIDHMIWRLILWNEMTKVDFFKSNGSSENRIRRL